MPILLQDLRFALRQIFRNPGFSLTAVLSLTLGIGAAVGLNQLIARWIESGTRDPILVLAASGLLILVAALACLLPARRASAVDPMVALRCD